jgi:hypothetical protein
LFVRDVFFLRVGSVERVAGAGLGGTSTAADDASAAVVADGGVEAMEKEDVAWTAGVTTTTSMGVGGVGGVGERRRLADDRG